MADQIFMPRAADANNDPVSGAEAYFYESGTVTPLTVYSDNGLLTAHPSPLVADADGVFLQVFVASATQVKVDVQTPAGVSLPGYPLDPAFMYSTDSSGAASITFSPITGNPATNVQAAIANLLGTTFFQTLRDTDDAATARETFGIGDGYLTASAFGGASYDGISESGLYILTGVATNAPASGTYYSVLHVEDGTRTGYASQLAMGFGPNELYTRQKNSGTWTSWTSWEETGVISKEYASTGQTITSAGSLTLAHGLGAKPRLFEFYLKCVTAEAGYSVDDEIVIPPGANANTGVSVFPDETNIGIRFGSNGAVFSAHNKSTGVNANLTNANWKLFVRAWA